MFSFSLSLECRRLRDDFTEVYMTDRGMDKVSLFPRIKHSKTRGHSFKASGEVMQEEPLEFPILEFHI